MSAFTASSTSMFPRLSGIARTKMQSVFGRGEDSTGLHRWVLLKNSIVQSNSATLPASPPPPPPPAPAPAPAPQHPREPESDVHEFDEQDMFSFPLLDDGNDPVSVGGASESQWLDSLLEELGDEDDYEDEDALSIEEPSPSTSLESSYTPFPSPFSSAESLVPSGALFCEPPSEPIAVPYPVPYPPLVRDAYAYELDDLPPVPDAIEDTSDDESDAPATPSSTGSSLASLIDAHRAAGSLHQRFHLPPPRIVVGSTDDPVCFPCDPRFDPLPSVSSIEEPHNIQQGGLYTAAPRYAYQEC